MSQHNGQVSYQKATFNLCSISDEKFVARMKILTHGYYVKCSSAERQDSDSDATGLTTTREYSTLAQ